MSLIQRLNDLPEGSMTAESVIENYDINSHNFTVIFIVKDKNYPPADSKAESRLLFFIAEFNGKYIPFIYFIVKFGETDDFIYDIVFYIGDDTAQIRKLLLNRRRYYILDIDKLVCEEVINCNAIIQEKIDDKANKEIENALHLFDKAKSVNKGSQDDFLMFQNTGAFWDFMGDRAIAFNKAGELYKKHNDLIIDLSVSKTNTISEPEPRGCMSNTLIGG